MRNSGASAQTIISTSERANVNAPYPGINILDESRTLPSFLRRGGCAIKKTSRSILSRADGVVIHIKLCTIGEGTSEIQTLVIARQLLSPQDQLTVACS